MNFLFSIDFKGFLCVLCGSNEFFRIKKCGRPHVPATKTGDHRGLPLNLMALGQKKTFTSSTVND
jgi:hypothetical protein